jgi:nucleoid DNA-binding protein
VTREELLHELMKSAGLSRGDAAKFYQGLLDVAVQRLMSEGQFTLPGFGVVKVTERKPREGRNPRTGERLMIPGKKALKFKPYKDLKEALNPTEEAPAPAEAPPAEPGCDSSSSGEAEGGGIY